MPARRSARSRWSCPGRRTSSARASGSMTSPGVACIRLGGEDGEHRRQILDPVGDDMDDAALALHLAGDGDEARAEHDGRNCSNTFGQTTMLAMSVSSSMVMKMTPLAVPGRWRTRTSPATVTRRAVPRIAERLAGDDATRREPRAEEGDRVRLQRQAEIAVVVDDMLADRHRRQGEIRLAADVGEFGGVEQRQAVVGLAAAELARRPERVAPVEAEGAEGIGIGEPLDRGAASGRSGARDRGPNRSPGRAPRRGLASSSRNPLIWRKPSRTAWVERISSRMSALAGWRRLWRAGGAPVRPSRLALCAGTSG